jgi:hypothetical protein
MLTYWIEKIREEHPALFLRIWRWMESKGYDLCEFFHEFGCPCGVEFDYDESGHRMPLAA